jgi:hypothetical protein
MTKKMNGMCLEEKIYMGVFTCSVRIMSKSVMACVESCKEKVNKKAIAAGADYVVYQPATISARLVTITGIGYKKRILLA